MNVAETFAEKPERLAHSQLSVMGDDAADPTDYTASTIPHPFEAPPSPSRDTHPAAATTSNSPSSPLRVRICEDSLAAAERSLLVRTAGLQSQSHPRWSSGDQTGSPPLSSSHRLLLARPSAGSPTVADEDNAFSRKSASSSSILGRASLSALNPAQHSQRGASPLGSLRLASASGPVATPMHPPRHAASWGVVDTSTDPRGSGLRLPKGSHMDGSGDRGSGGGGRPMRVSLRDLAGGGSGNGSACSTGRSSLRSLMAEAEGSVRTVGRMSVRARTFA